MVDGRNGTSMKVSACLACAYVVPLGDKPAIARCPECGGPCEVMESDALLDQAMRARACRSLEILGYAMMGYIAGVICFHFLVWELLMLGLAVGAVSAFAASVASRGLAQAAASIPNTVHRSRAMIQQVLLGVSGCFALVGVVMARNWDIVWRGWTDIVLLVGKYGFVVLMLIGVTQCLRDLTRVPILERHRGRSRCCALWALHGVWVVPVCVPLVAMACCFGLSIVIWWMVLVSLTLALIQSIHTHLATEP